MGRVSKPTSGFGGLIRSLRLGREMTQADLAREAGMTAGYVAKVELNSQMPSREVVERLAAALHVSTGALVEARGQVPTVVEKAFRETPEALLWFASRSQAERKRLAGASRSGDDAEAEERKQIRRLKKRLENP